MRRQGAAWQLRAAERSGWRIEYNAWQGTFPRAVRLISDRVDMTAAISQLESNVPIDAAAFDVDVPRDALPLTLEELRDAGPLRGAEPSDHSTARLCGGRYGGRSRRKPAAFNGTSGGISTNTSELREP